MLYFLTSHITLHFSYTFVRTYDCLHADAVKVWDIIAELVEICCSPAPPNPFALDFDYLDCLHSAEKALATAAISHVLQKVLASGRPHAYDRRGACVCVCDVRNVSAWNLDYVCVACVA